jgi:hypothetical protein
MSQSEDIKDPTEEDATFVGRSIKKRYSVEISIIVCHVSFINRYLWARVDVKHSASARLAQRSRSHLV